MPLVPIRALAGTLPALLLPVAVLAADLTLDRDAPTPFGIDWAAQRATAVVVNAGSAPAGPFRVQLGLSHPSALAATRPQARGSVTVAGLGPGEVVEITIDFADFGHRTIDITRLTSGRLDVRIDADGQVAETNEHNNDFGRVF